MSIRKSPADRIFEVVNTLILLGVVAITLYPLLYVAFASLSDPAQIAAWRGVLWAPLGFSTAAYKAVFDNPFIYIGYRNTLFYVIVGTAANMLMTILGAYCLSRQNVMWKRPISLLIVFTLFFSGGLIPSFLLVAKTLDWVDSPLAVIVPGLINTFNLLVLRTAFEAVPPSLEEAARMDGANDFTILFKVIVPLSLPSIAVITLFYAVGHWNAFFSALIYFRNVELFPLQLILRQILIANDTQNMTAGTSSGDVEAIATTIKYAIIMVATLPILFVYPFAQRYFVKGVMVGGVKE
ncbi:MAG: carbohydrate ABC transporter permease [Anaerolineae bacterium]|nr:carbohydrate ABC transporter permease [Anaerolineae bacterium]